MLKGNVEISVHGKRDEQMTYFGHVMTSEDSLQKDLVLTVSVGR